jgi:hypothetical protein
MQTFTPIQYLKIDIASNFGLDKKSWDDRLAWFDENEKDLDNLTKQAEEPALFYAGIQAYRKALKGDPIKYPISLDATASGAQILAILIGCEKSAKLCNVLDTGRREDLYTILYGGMLSRINDQARITRDDAKQAIMTSLYGSKKEPKQIFGEGELLDVFYETMKEDATGIWEINQDILDLWQPDVLSHDWVLPDDFHVKTKTMVPHTAIIHFLNEPMEVTTYVNAPSERGLSIGANMVHSIDGMIVREMGRRCGYDPVHVLDLLELIAQSSYMRSPRLNRAKDKQMMVLWNHYLESGFLSAAIIDYLDTENMAAVDYSIIKKLLLSLPEKPFQVLSIHDCFRVHPNYANDLRRQYNAILQAVSDSTMLDYLANQVVKHKVKVMKFSDLSGQILSTNYALS